MKKAGNKNVYFKSRLVEGADPATVKAKKFPLFFDKKDYYYKGKGLNVANVKKFEAQKQMVQLAYNLRESLENNNLDDFGRILHENWLLKRSLTSGISTGIVDEVYNKGIEAGALGGKLLGAGGAGFILFYCPKEKQAEFRERMGSIIELNFKFDNYGSKIIYVGEKVNIWKTNQ